MRSSIWTVEPPPTPSMLVKAVKMITIGILMATETVTAIEAANTFQDRTDSVTTLSLATPEITIL